MDTGNKPFNKESEKRISFEELVQLIGQKCDYKFAIIDYEVDDELNSIAKRVGLDLKGYKHVIETSGRNILIIGMVKIAMIGCLCHLKIIC